MAVNKKMGIWSRIGYRLLSWLCLLVGKLPEWFLYHCLLDVIYFFIYRVAGYRVKVVRANLALAFPEKTARERLRIEKLFYRHLCEVMIDTIDFMSITPRQVRKRFVIENLAEHEASAGGMNWIAALAHYGSWEYFAAYPLYTPSRTASAYHPLHNRVIDRLMLKSRSRFGMQLIQMFDLGRFVAENRGNHEDGERENRNGCEGRGYEDCGDRGKRERSNECHDGRSNRVNHEGRKGSNDNDSGNYALGMIMDQSPTGGSSHVWIKFLGQPSRFFSSMEKFAVRYNLKVYFFHVEKTARARYRGRFEMIYDGCEKVAGGEIVARYAARLEEQIRRRPELWMWSHRRWKRPAPPEVRAMLDAGQRIVPAQKAHVKKP